MCMCRRDWRTVKGITVTLYILVTTFVAGCAFPPAWQRAGKLVTISDAMGNVTPYPCVSIGVVAETPWHFYEDPLKTDYSHFRVHHVQRISGPGETKSSTPYISGEGTILLTRSEDSDEIIFAPGFNPVGSFAWDFVKTRSGEDPSFWSGYKRCRCSNQRLEEDFRNVELSTKVWQRSGEGWLVRLIPLYTADAETGGRRMRRNGGNLVNHCMLVWLLERKDIWKDLRRFYKRDESREGVRLAAEAVTQMVAAHREKWPDYQWTKAQTDIIDWCKQVSSGP